ncbi:hypothetical protein GOP47_0018209 [Adiantum capillus-veneris]|uniref:Uncharacterized protein n=1 Tax=Adiantum capillus-veneris TaxID=13818 RepID=A0A9D4UI06_ADICA|nr:hypothetical protein GOP47_0018209 [Adiantum capillus-veneris]
MVMRVSFAYQPSFSRSTASELYSVTSVSCCSKGKQRLFFTAVCSLPARDVVIDFGKYKGCKMGTLPSRYLQWLVREAHHSSLTVWGDYAKQVLQDPYYKDRLEWQSIEKLGVRGEMQKGGPLAASAGVKGSMIALGWDLLDSSAWSKVNFSLLGTTVGGRIPRKELNQLQSAIAKPKPKTVPPKPAMEATMSTSSGGRVSPSRLDGSFSSLKVTGNNTILSSKLTNIKASVGESQPTKSLTLQEELLRRRQLRRERSAPKSLTTLPPAIDDVQSVFPGRESLLNRARKRADT